MSFEAKYLSDGNRMDHTPSGAVAAGEVVVINSAFVTVANEAIAANALGSVATEGDFEVAKNTGITFAVGDAVYWSESSNYATTTTTDVFMGRCIKAAGSSATTVKVHITRTRTDSVNRSSLVEDVLKPFGVTLFSVREQDGTALATTASSGKFGLSAGTFGSASPKLIGEAASGNSKTDYCRFLLPLPAEYVSGGDITIRVRSQRTGTLNTAATIDIEAYKSDKGAGIGSDLCATAAQTVTASYANYAFTVTATGLVAGDLLDVRLTAVANDTGGSNNKLIEIGGIDLLCDVKG